MMDKLSSHKGMSQILTLIVAASVLMMTALIVVFMAQGSLNDLFSSTNEQGCRATVESRCSISGGTFPIPSQCSDVSGDTIETYSDVDREQTGTVVCEGATYEGDDSE